MRQKIQTFAQTHLRQIWRSFCSWWTWGLLVSCSHRICPALASLHHGHLAPLCSHTHSHRGFQSGRNNTGATRWEKGGMATVSKNIPWCEIGYIILQILLEILGFAFVISKQISFPGFILMCISQIPKSLSHTCMIIKNMNIQKQSQWLEDQWWETVDMEFQSRKHVILIRIPAKYMYIQLLTCLS